MYRRGYNKPRVDDYSSNNALIGIVIAVLIIIVIAVVLTQTSAGFQVVNYFKNANRSLKDYNIILFYNPSCPHCIRTFEMLGPNVKDLTAVDITTEKGKELANSFGASGMGVPMFVSTRYSTGYVGFLPSISEILDQLTPKENAAKPIDPSQFVLLTKEGCKFCEDAKQMIQQANFNVKIVDFKSPEGQELISKFVPNVSGFPTWISLTSGKSTTGFKPLEEIMKEIN